MKLVYKCDFCYDMFTEDKIFEHEPFCTFNPIMKTCHLCKNKQYWKDLDGADSSVYTCKFKLKQDIWNCCHSIRINCEQFEQE